MKFIYLLPFLLWLSLLLSACTTIQEKDQTTEPASWKQQQKTLGQLQSWAINGRISVQTEIEGGQADYLWQQHNKTDYDIRLQAPMGAGTTLIEGRLTGVSLKTSSGDELFDTDVDKLMLRLNGWPVPVSGLQYWVKGLPAPGSPFEINKWNKTGLPAVMLQDGWRIELRKYKKVGELNLPGKLFINRQNGEEVDVRLIIRQWQPGLNKAGIKAAGIK
ncbi:MAG: lipoprotein insertase outer membrane protein LolB [Gammaproteobacteria bacterium]|nr:lipoprotein insertase outer membrane protein LolB [Gammaproteobacteria bacterium]